MRFESWVTSFSRPFGECGPTAKRFVSYVVLASAAQRRHRFFTAGTPDCPTLGSAPTTTLRADRILAEELARLRCTRQEFLARKKNDPAKLAIAARLHQETTLPTRSCPTPKPRHANPPTQTSTVTSKRFTCLKSKSDFSNSREFNNLAES